MNNCRRLDSSSPWKQQVLQTFCQKPVSLALKVFQQKVGACRRQRSLQLSRTLDNDSFWEIMDSAVAVLSCSLRGLEWLAVGFLPAGPRVWQRESMGTCCCVIVSPD